MTKIVIDGEIAQWGYSSRWLRNKLSNMSGGIEVDLSTYGGDVFEGIDMYNQFREYAKKGNEVVMIAGAKVMSIGSLIYLAGTKRKAHKNSTIMIHKAWTWLAGNSDDLLQEAKILDAIDMILVNEYDKVMNEGKDAIKDILAKEGWYIGQVQLEETNFVDEFIEADDEVMTLAMAKKAFVSNMDRFSAKAKEEGVKPNFDEVKASILSCNDGKCPLGTVAAMPSDNVKLVNSKTGDNMTEKEIQAMQEQNKVYEANRTTLQARIETLELQAKSLSTDLDTKNDEVNALEADAETKISEAKDGAVSTAKAEVETRVSEAFKTGVASQETILAMVNAKDSKDATAVALAAKESNGGTHQSDEPGKLAKEDSEKAIAVAIANQISVKGK